jgi:3-hydroxypropanoate dehydrogenase
MSIPAESANSIVLDDATADLLFREARTANTFTEESVSKEQIEAIYDLVKWGPTAFNAQTLRVVIVESPEAKARLIEHLGDANKAKTASAPLVAILAADTDFHENIERVLPNFPQAKNFFLEYETREAFAKAQAWLQAGYFIIGVRAAGLAAGPMTGFNAAGVDADLLAGTTLKSIAVINIGHPGADAWFGRNPRLSHDEVVTSL